MFTLGDVLFVGGLPCHKSRALFVGVVIVATLSPFYVLQYDVMSTDFCRRGATMVITLNYNKALL